MHERNRVASSKKIKRPNLSINCYKKGLILKNEKKPNEGQIFEENLLKN